MQSIGARGGTGINQTTSLYTEIGTKISYAAAQDKTRPVVSIGQADIDMFNKIALKEMGIQK